MGVSACFVPAGVIPQVSYLGAEPVEHTVSVVDDQITRQEVKIGEQVEEIENILVVGQAASANRALNAERSADNFKSVLSADAIGQFPDENVSEALQRVTGVSIERDQVCRLWVFAVLILI